MKKTLIICTALLAFVALRACKNGAAANDTATDTLQQCDTVAEAINQYDSEGRKTGRWEYLDEATGWFCEENYVEGLLDGPATYYYEEITTIEMSYCKGIECGEMHIFFEGTEGDTGIRLTDITKVDTVINGHLLHYRAYCKTNDVYEGIYRNEGTCYYEDISGLQVNGFLGVGDWIVYDSDGSSRTVTLDKPTSDFNIK